MAVKLDMSKAYNKVKWLYLEVVMKALDFSAQWIELIIYCVLTIDYSILVNRKLGNNFIPSRRLRQWDPLSLPISHVHQRV